MRWYVSRQGKTKGPFDKADIIAAIRAGQVGLDDTVCQEGTQEWLPVRELGAFAAAAPVAPAVAAIVAMPAPAPTLEQASTARSRPWLAIAGLALGVLSVGLILWGLFELHARQVAILAEVRAVNLRGNSMITELQKLTAPPAWADEKQVTNTCNTDRSTVTCTFTNTQKFPVATCAQGLLYQKEATGVRLQALPMCTGKLMPAETRVVTASWVAGFADDICYRENQFGKHLDWSKCVFTTQPYDLSGALK